MTDGPAASQTARDARRAVLLEAALDELAERPFDVTADSIAARAGLEREDFDDSFTDLDEALVAVLDAVAEQIAVYCLGAWSATQGDPLAKTRAAMATFVSILADDKRKARVAMDAAVSVPVLRAHRGRLLNDFARLVAVEAAAWFGGDVEDAQTPRMTLAGLLFIGGCAEIIRAWVLGDIVVERETVVDLLAEQFVATLTPRL